MQPCVGFFFWSPACLEAGIPALRCISLLTSGGYRCDLTAVMREFRAKSRIFER